MGGNPCSRLIIPQRHLWRLTALYEISLAVGRGQFVSIVGPNGAGKTTLFKAISGTLQPNTGRMTSKIMDLLAIAPSKRAH